jgi:hypothetical protein
MHQDEVPEEQEAQPAAHKIGLKHDHSDITDLQSLHSHPQTTARTKVPVRAVDDAEALRSSHKEPHPKILGSHRQKAKSL